MTPTASPIAGPTQPTLLVACLCAAWCKLCDDYRAVFAGARTVTGGQAQFVWLDIEDDEAVLGPLDVDNFPTLLIARGDAPVFFGTLTPQPGTLARLLQKALVDDLGRVDDAAARALVVRVRAWASRTAAPVG